MSTGGHEVRVAPFQTKARPGEAPPGGRPSDSPVDPFLVSDAGKLGNWLAAPRAAAWVGSGGAGRHWILPKVALGLHVDGGTEGHGILAWNRREVIIFPGWEH